MERSKNIDLNKMISVFSIIFLGALGSGLWDVFLKDLFFFLGELFVTLLSSIYADYVDVLYKNVGEGSGGLLYLPSLALIFFIITSPIFIFLFFYRQFMQFDIAYGKRPESNEYIHKFGLYILNNRLKFYLILLIPCLLVSILYINLLITELSKISAINQINRRLEIIRPLINEQRYYELRSEYRLIDNKNKIVSFLINIDNISDVNNIVLPEIELFGIDIHKTKNQSTSSVGS